MSTLGSFSEYARHIDVSPAYVTKLKAQGRLVIVRGEGGKEMVDFELSDRLVKNTSDMGRAGNGANAQSKSAQAGSSLTRPMVGGDRMDSTFKQARTHEAAFRAKITELEYKEKIGQLIDAEEVKRSEFETARAVRDALLSLPDRLAPLLAAATSADECHRLLDVEIRAALTQVAERLAQQAEEAAA